MKSDHVKLLREFYKEASEIITICSDNAVIGITEPDNHGISEVKASGYNEYGKLNVENWRNIIKVSADFDSLIGLTSEGRVMSTGDTTCKSNEASDLDVSGWTDIVDIAKGKQVTVGLKKDGKVIATGSNIYHSCDVGKFDSVVQIIAGYGYTAGLRTDGTVAFAGVDRYHQNRDMKYYYDTSSWNNIVKLFTEDSYSSRIYGLKEDGTIVTTGDTDSSDIQINNWSHIIDLFPNGSSSIGIKEDGSIEIIYNPNGSERERAISKLSDYLNNIVYAESGYRQCVFLRADGTVIIIGFSQEQMKIVSQWKNIVAVKFIDENLIVGLKANGEVLQSSYNIREASDNENFINNLVSGKNTPVDYIYYTIDTRSWKLKRMDLSAYVLAVRLMTEGDVRYSGNLLCMIDYFSNANELYNCLNKINDKLTIYKYALQGAKKIYEMYELDNFININGNKRVFEKLYELLSYIIQLPEAKAYLEKLKIEQKDKEQQLADEKIKAKDKMDRLKREYAGLSIFDLKKKRLINKEIAHMENYLNILFGKN